MLLLPLLLLLSLRLLLLLLGLLPLLLLLLLLQALRGDQYTRLHEGVWGGARHPTHHPGLLLQRAHGAHDGVHKGLRQQQLDGREGVAEAVQGTCKGGGGR